MKKLLISGIAAVVAVMMMSGCGNTASEGASGAETTAAPAETTTAAADGAETAAAETAAAETTAETAAETTAPAAETTAETTAPADTAADTAVTTENDFLKGLNEQMAQFKEGAGNISIDGGTAPTVSYAEVPAETSVSAAAAPSGDTMVAGDDDHGYLDVPADWQMTTAPDKGKWDIIRYHDAAGQNIISLQRYESTLAQMAADKIYDLIDDSPLTEITGSCHTEVCGLSTYRIDAKILAEDHYLIIWVMQDESGDARYLSAESPDDQFILNIASTYRTTK